MMRKMVSLLKMCWIVVDKVPVTKRAISLKERNWIKQAQIDKIKVFCLNTNLSFAVNLWRGIFVEVKHFIFLFCTTVLVVWKGI